MSTLRDLSEGFTAALESAGPSVVRVEARRRYPLSGLVWSEDGVVVTTSRAVEREEDLRLGLADGGTVAASFVGRDPRTDLAVLRAETGGLAPAGLLEPDGLKLGQWVLMAARPREGLQVTAGIVSLLGGAWLTVSGGQVERLIQTDAQPFPGFSGGPLLTIAGEVVGLNTSALTRGMPVALPVATLRRVVGTLLEHGRMRRGYLGVAGQPVRLPENLAGELQQPLGVLLVSVEAQSPAGEAGLVVGDIIVSLDEQPVQRPGDLPALLDEARIGQGLPVKLIRGGRVQDLRVEVGER